LDFAETFAGSIGSASSFATCALAVGFSRSKATCATIMCPPAPQPKAIDGAHNMSKAMPIDMTFLNTLCACF
jgi:hypothetical protein